MAEKKPEEAKKPTETINEAIKARLVPPKPPVSEDERSELARTPAPPPPGESSLTPSSMIMRNTEKPPKSPKPTGDDGQKARTPAPPPPVPEQTIAKPAPKKPKKPEKSE